MAADLFGHVDRAPRLGSRRWYTLPLSILTHAAGIVAVLVIPLLAIGELPAIRRAINFGDIDIMPVVPPPPVSRRAATSSNRDLSPPRRNVAPIEPPSEIGPERLDEPAPSLADVVGDPDGVEGGLPIDSTRTFVPPPPPPPDVPKSPLRPGGKIVVPRRIVYVQPVYPPHALSGQIEGRVVIEAIVGPSGEVTNARIVRSVPLLNEAALAAVRQWKYTPTLLNGVPVSVILTVSVDFKLAR